MSQAASRLAGCRLASAAGSGESVKFTSKLGPCVSGEKNESEKLHPKLGPVPRNSKVKLACFKTKEAPKPTEGGGGGVARMEGVQQGMGCAGGAEGAMAELQRGG